jgi:hypothetical protein
VVQPPAADRTADLVQGVLADGGQERGERLPAFVAGRAGAEGEPQERERGVRMPTSPVGVLAVHDPGLGRVQPQPDLGHPVCDRLDQHPGLTLACAVHHRVVGVALELDGWEPPGHPGVKRVVHEQVRQHGRDRRPLWGTAVSLLQGAVG